MNKLTLNKKILIIVFTNDIYKFHYALNLGASMKAIEIKVNVFFAGYACKYISQDWKKFDNNSTNKKFKKKKMPTLEESFAFCKELKVNFFYCDTALDFVNIKKSNIIKSVKIKPIGMYSILNEHKKDQLVFI